MDTLKMEDWIIEICQHDSFDKEDKLENSINATYKPERINPNNKGELYDIQIANDDGSGFFFSTIEDLCDAISYHEDTGWEENSLEKLTEKIRENLNTGGDYKLILIGNSSFDVARRLS